MNEDSCVLKRESDFGNKDQMDHAFHFGPDVGMCVCVHVLWHYKTYIYTHLHMV